MSSLELVIGNKNYSSWSFRPWIMMAMAGLKFKETLVKLDTPEFKPAVLRHSKAGKVPILHHGKVTVWETLAIMEYLADAYPSKHFWPQSKPARAMARAVSHEMHAGFGALRNACPMNMRRPRKAVHFSVETLANIARIEALWKDCRAAYGKGGPFLFGQFTVADAMYAPVVSRFETYDIKVSKISRAYMDAVQETKAYRSWKDAALKEPWIVPSDEVD
jgi:glutathione S-transferase